MWAIYAKIKYLLPGHLASICLGLIIGCQPASKPEGLEGPLRSFPLTRVVPAEGERLGKSDLESAQPIDFMLAMGNGATGYNVLRLTPERHITYVFHGDDALVPIAPDARVAEWRKATFSTTQAVVTDLRQLLLDVEFHSWDREYDAEAFDGLQIVVTVQINSNRKAVHFKNHFPDGLRRLVEFVNARILVPNEEALINAEQIQPQDASSVDLHLDWN